jgi:hypothetical protein
VPSSTVTEQPPSPVLLIELPMITIVADDAAALPWLIVLAPEFHWPAHSDRLGESGPVTRSMRRPAARTTRAARLKTARLHGKSCLYPPRCCRTAAKAIPPLPARADTLTMRLT